MKKNDFVHLHNHSRYSAFDGFASVEDLVVAAKKNGMVACGLTDHGTFAGAIDFLSKCRIHGVKPILGMETYFSRDHKIKNKEGQPDGRRGNRHLNLIAQNYVGYKNVCALSQISSLEGYYYDPRVDIELLNKHSEGVICTSACLSSIINWNLSIDRYDEAKKSVGIFQDIFKDNFYLEMMFHGLASEAKILPYIQKLSHETGVKTIVTNDTHYIKQEDAKFHEYVMCASSNRTMKDPKRIKFPYKEFYFKSYEEMYKIFGHVEECLSNTLEIVDKCDYSDIVFVEDGGSMRLPKFDLPDGFNSQHDYLEKLAWDGLKKLGLSHSQKHVDRLSTELSDVRLIWETKKYDFATYFLIVHDIMEFAKKNKIAAGIRGSGYGSLLLKCIGIVEANLDIMDYGLLWSRFLGFDENFFISELDFGKYCKKQGFIT